MRLHINPRGNGACPLCKKNGKCRVAKKLTNSIKDDKENDHIDIVIYTCPDFEETT